MSLKLLKKREDLKDVKLNEADNPWRPSVLVEGDGLRGSDFKAREKDELIPRIRGILNKLTPEKFETLLEEFIKLKIDTPEKMEAVTILVFEKAIDEPNFSVSYACLCHRIITEVQARDDRMDSGTKSNLGQFRNALLDKTELKFTQSVSKSGAKDKKLQQIRASISMCKDIKERVELEVLLKEEECKIRRRSIGTVRFIGELFKISILTGKIMHTCIEALLKDPNNEDMLECLCILLATVGMKFEQTRIPHTEKAFFSLDTAIQRMQNIASRSENTKISSRVRFMLQDVIDLRKEKWKSSPNKAFKTMEQIEKEVNNDQLNKKENKKKMNRVNQISGSGNSNSGCNHGRSGNYGKSHAQRGDTDSLKRKQGGGIGRGGRSQSGNSNANSHSNQSGKVNRSVIVNTNKLVDMTNVDVNIKKMSGASLFQADTAWLPSGLVKGGGLSDPDFKALDKDELILRLRGILNKLTAEEIETVVEEIIKLKIDTPEKMEACMILIFEKGIYENNFLVAFLCYRLITEVKARDDRMDSGTNSNLGQFRNALLDKTEREFTQNVTKSSAKDEKLQQIRDSISMCKDINERVELENLLKEEECKIRRRSNGTVRFIGELFNISILTGKIMHTCIEALLEDPNNEDMLECLCELLTTVGSKFEHTPIPKADNVFFSLDTVIQRMQNIASRNENTKISSRVRLMLQDVIDLRKKRVVIDTQRSTQKRQFKTSSRRRNW